MRISKETKISDIAQGGHRRPDMLVAYITLGMVPIEWHIASSRLQTPVNAKSATMIAKGGRGCNDSAIMSATAVKGMEVATARNFVFSEVLKMSNKPYYILFFGDDMLPPWNGLISLHEEMEKGQWDVLTGLYYWKGDPPTPLTWRNDAVGRQLPGIHFKLGEVINVDVTGLDFTLIKVNSIKQNDYPWFKTGNEVIDDISKVYTEDVFYLNKMKSLYPNFKVGVHTGIRCGHLDIKTGRVF